MSDELGQRVEALERRIAELEGARNTLRAPLRVVDDDGRMVLLVEARARGVRLRLSRGGPDEPYISLSLNERGGYIAFSNASGERASGLFVEDGKATLQVNDHGSGANGLLYVGDDGAVLVLRDAAGNATAALSAEPEGGLLDIMPATGEGGVTVSTRDGHGRLALANADGKRTVRLHARPKGGEVTLYNAELKRAARLQADDSGSLALANAHGQLQAAVAAGPEGGALAISTPEGRIALSLNVISGGGYLIALDAQEKFAVEVGTGPECGGELIVRDRDGNVLFSRPEGAGEGERG